ncbi:MAG: nitrous oxide reductase family maturation protein NosD [Myxococcaceae bacterium]
MAWQLRGVSLLLLAAGCASSQGVGQAPAERKPPPAPPPGCLAVLPTHSLQALLAAAQPGDAFCLSKGTWTGNFEVPPGVVLWGTPESVLKTPGVGTTVLLRSDSVLQNLTVQGSGGRQDVLDAAVKLQGSHIRVEGIAVRDSLFGILAERSSRILIRDSHVKGTGGEALGMRGDGIHLWETTDSRVEGNRVENARDCVVWYSKNNDLVGNEVRDGRYGVHLMYSHNNRVMQNRFVRNEVGLFVMYSRNIHVEGNQLLASQGGAGMGLGIKESGNLTVRSNLLAHNTQGIFLDNSPLQPSDFNLFEDNTIQLSDLALGILSLKPQNTFRRNAFRDNRVGVRVEGGGDALAIAWVENAWSDYAGYDLDGDGFGDLPYEPKDLASSLTATHPQLSFFVGTPVMSFIALAGEVAPLFAPKPVLLDKRPWLGGPRAH